MPVRKDEQGNRRVEMEVLVPGTPDEVWEAMATGPGNTGWFVPTEVVPGLGGSIRMTFGEGAVAEGEITAWDPPHRCAYVERDWQPGAPAVATEITITARSGDRCVVRMVHSLFSSSDAWDDQLEGFESGWPGFFAVLRLYLGHFKGMQAGSFMVLSAAAGEALPVWRRLCEELGLTAASVGERRELEAGPDRWSGVVEQVFQDAQQRWVLLRIDAPEPGIALVGTGGTSADPGEMEKEVGKVASRTHVSVARYHYGNGASERAREGERRWRAWFSETFPAPEESGR